LHVQMPKMAESSSASVGASAEYDTLRWWKGHLQDLPCWSSAARDVVLVQPSLATSEQVFSLLKANFGPQQDCWLQDYIESSLMLQFNKR